jgi:hypothetical protein
LFIATADYNIEPEIRNQKVAYVKCLGYNAAHPRNRWSPSWVLSAKVGSFLPQSPQRARRKQEDLSDLCDLRGRIRVFGPTTLDRETIQKPDSKKGLIPSERE